MASKKYEVETIQNKEEKKYLSCGNYSHNLCLDCGELNAYFMVFVKIIFYDKLCYNKP